MACSLHQTDEMHELVRTTVRPWLSMVLDTLRVWLIGLLAGVAGNVIHVLLLVGLAILVYNIITGRRAV